jgi:hypothetical protein
VLYTISILIYIGSKAYRKKQGINLDEIHKSIPVE